MVRIFSATIFTALAIQLALAAPTQYRRDFGAKGNFRLGLAGGHPHVSRAESVVNADAFQSTPIAAANIDVNDDDNTSASGNHGQAIIKAVTNELSKLFGGNAGKVKRNLERIFSRAVGDAAPAQAGSQADMVNSVGANIANAIFDKMKTISPHADGRLENLSARAFENDDKDNTSDLVARGRGAGRVGGAGIGKAATSGLVNGAASGAGRLIFDGVISTLQDLFDGNADQPATNAEKRGLFIRDWVADLEDEITGIVSTSGLKV